jgi:hypothetical protein
MQVGAYGYKRNYPNCAEALAKLFCQQERRSKEPFSSRNVESADENSVDTAVLYTRGKRTRAFEKDDTDGVFSPHGALQNRDTFKRVYLYLRHAAPKAEQAGARVQGAYRLCRRFTFKNDAGLIVEFGPQAQQGLCREFPHIDARIEFRRSVHRGPAQLVL